MDPFFYTRGPRLRRRFSAIVPQLAAHPGEDRPAQHIQQPGRRDNELEEDGSHVC